MSFRTAFTIACALCLAKGVGSEAGARSVDASVDAWAITLEDAASQQQLVRQVDDMEEHFCQAKAVPAGTGRCLQLQQLQRRLGRRPAWKQQLAGEVWRAEFGRSVSRLAWGMPGCPVERKMAARGGVMVCNEIHKATAAFASRPLLMHVVKDAMDWQHFDMHAVLTCPYKCLWAGAVHPPLLADVLVYDCLQLPPPSGSTSCESQKRAPLTPLGSVLAQMAFPLHASEISDKSETEREKHVSVPAESSHFFPFKKVLYRRGQNVTFFGNVVTKNVTS